MNPEPSQGPRVTGSMKVLSRSETLTERREQEKTVIPQSTRRIQVLAERHSLLLFLLVILVLLLRQ